MNKYFTFTDIDKKLWKGIGAVGLIFVIVFSVFTSASPFFYIEKFLVAVFVMFLPGYSILKLYFDEVKLSDYVIADKVMVSFGLSVISMVIPYFLSTYLRPYEFNTDERGMELISGNVLTILLVFIVVGSAFGYKHYLLKKKGSVQ